ncbi:MAG: pimeloyl-ACP methyl ester esterase BioH [Pseudomonadota bacterium]|jgi:pimeloyl-[acyl-carrier protein] methyl ester esterase
MNRPPLHVDAAPSTGNVADGAMPLVLLHGWGMNLRAFDPLRAALPEVETRAIDLPGHGRSPWWPGAASFQELCEAVLAALPPRCHLLGWSLGGKVALALAARHPARIARLVLLAATPKFAQAPDWPHGMPEPSMRAFRAVLEQDWRQTLEDFIWLQVRGTREADEVAQALSAALLAHGEPRREALLAGMALLEQVDLRPLVPQVVQPALVIAGRNDRVTAPDAAGWLAANLPRARLHVVPRAGHAPHLSHALELAELLRPFVTAPAEEAPA